jgi:hypothetical protein
MVRAGANLVRHVGQNASAARHRMNATPRAVPAPKPGDVIVLHLPVRRGISSYLLYRVGHRAQALCTEYAEARQRAERQAGAALVDAWYTSDEQAFIRLAEHRPST